MTTSMGNAGGSAAETARRQREKADRLNRSAENYEKGAAGEVEVAAALGRLDAGFSVLHDLDIPGSKANVDHVVIGPTGVILVDAKAYLGVLKPGSGTLWRGRIPIRRECATAKWEADQLSAFLSVPVRTVLCFVGTELPAPVTRLDDVTVCSLEALVTHVQSGPAELRPEVIEVLTLQAAQLVRNQPMVRGAQPPVRSAPRAVARASSKPPSGPRKSSPTILRLVGGLLAALAFLALIPTLTHVLTNSLTPSTTTTVAPALEIPLVTVLPLAQIPDSVAPTLVDAPPTVQFTCAGGGQGWTATLAPTQYAQDPAGYHVWFRVGGDTELWTYAGRFLSGVSQPTALGQIEASTSFELRYDRDWLYNDPTLAAGYAAFTTGVDC